MLAGTAALVLAVFAALIGAASWRLRARTRAQMTAREGETLHAAAAMLIARQEPRRQYDSLLGEESGLLDAALETSALKGVIALRLYDDAGTPAAAVPQDLAPQDISPQDLARLRRFQPISRYDPQARLDALFSHPASLGGKTAPLLEVTIPLHPPGEETGVLLGAARYWIDGQDLAGAFADLDANLLRQAGAAFAAGGGLVLLVLVLSFQRLMRAYALLAERSRKLQEANRKLVLAAKSSAVGAISAHLIHSLKNPLAGLQSIVKNQTNWPGRETADEMTRRMAASVREITSILRQETHDGLYDITLAEMREILLAKTAPLAEQAGVRAEFGPAPPASLNNRDGNLAILIAQNLIFNAIEATPPGKKTAVSFKQEKERFCLTVSDEGNGLPEAIQKHLFSPVKTAKSGGSGLGLAISKQMAEALHADLTLRHTGSDGTVFALRIPFPRADNL